MDKRNIKPHKGGRTVNTHVRMTPEVQSLLKQLKVSAADLLEKAVRAEAKVTALGEWELIAPPPIGEGNESVSNLVLTLKAYFPPPNTFDGEPYFVPQCDIYHHRSTAGFTGWQSEYRGEGGLYSKTIGWIEILDPPFSKQELLSMKELIDKQRTPAES